MVGSQPSARRVVKREDLGLTPAQGAVILKPRPTAWVGDDPQCGLKGRDTLADGIWPNEAGKVTVRCPSRCLAS